MLAGLAVSAAGFALYPLVREAWHAFVLALLTGGGGGTWLTMQSSVLASITPPGLRHLAFARQRVAANVGLGLGGFAGGLLVTTTRPETFTLLFALNAATFLAYGAFLVRLPAGPRASAARTRGGYRVVLRDGAFIRVLAVNAVLVAGGIALVNSLFPVHARNEAGAGEDLIGGLFLLNSLLIVTAQVPVAGALAGRRRMAGLALVGLLFASCWGLTLAAGAVAAVALLVLAMVALSAGECVYDAVQGPLTADLAPEGLLGRYMAASGFSWQLGFIAGPGIGGALLALGPGALWPAAAMLCLAAAGYALRLERRLPGAVRLTPARA
jgi:MFS family permease